MGLHLPRDSHASSCTVWQTKYIGRPQIGDQTHDHKGKWPASSIPGLRRWMPVWVMTYLTLGKPAADIVSMNDESVEHETNVSAG